MSKKYSMVIATNCTSICWVYKEKIVKTTHTTKQNVHTISLIIKLNCESDMQLFNGVT